MANEAKQHAAERPVVHATSSYRADIDGLRAIAVIGVLVFHAFPDFLRGGFVGVDVFFVISGFLITRILLQDLNGSSFSITDFYARRIRRIFPALLMVIGACLVFGWKTLLAEDLTRLAKQAVGGVGFVANLVLWNDAGYFDQASATKPLLHLWSLGIEEQFYMAWPPLIWAMWKLRLPLMQSILAVGILSFALCLWSTHHEPTAAFYSPMTRAWELMIGGALAQWSLQSSATKRAPSPVLAHALSWAGLILIVYAMLRIGPRVPFPGKWALLPTVGTACLIAAGDRTFLSRTILSRKALVAVGLISYPLYLWHWPLLVFARAMAGGHLRTYQSLAVLAASAGLAVLTWLLVERPLRSYGRRSWAVPTLGGGMIVLGVVAATIAHLEGVPSRYPAIVQRATEYDLEAYRSALRNHVCFMELGEKTDRYVENCVDTGSKPLWVLWGDSAAASLFTGFRAMADRSGQMRLGQFTNSSCPPMVGVESGNSTCASNNDIALQAIAQLRPDTVLLSAMWHEYDKANLVPTIEKLKGIGVRRVVIIGPPPSWSDTPSRILFKLWNDDPLHSTPPARLDYGVYGMGQTSPRPGEKDVRTATAEAILRAAATQTGATYISLVDALCNEQGCLTRADANSGETFYLDVVHLTPAGSRFTVSRIQPQLMDTAHAP